MSRKRAYPIFLFPDSEGYLVKIPDFDIMTQGDSIPDAMEMARDAIGIMGIDLEDEGKEIPEPYSIKMKPENNVIMTLVDVDFVTYRKKMDNRAVKKNCTIPYWLSIEGDKAGVNYSRLLQDAIINFLDLEKA